eukprot:6214682-Pleurochrysis_carterae.AAC.1
MCDLASLWEASSPFAPPTRPRRGKHALWGDFTFLAHPTMNDTSPAKKWQPSRNGVGRADMLRQSSRLAPYPVKSYVLFACEVVSALRADTGTTPIHMLRLHPVLAHMHAP